MIHVSSILFTNITRVEERYPGIHLNSGDDDDDNDDVDDDDVDDERTYV